MSNPMLEQMLANARQDVKEITPSEARELAKSKEVLFVDVREPSECDQTGCLPGATRIPFQEVAAMEDLTPDQRPAELGDQEKSVVVYCAAGVRSLLAAQALKKMGFKNVVSMEGGIVGWHSEGFPIER